MYPLIKQRRDDINTEAIHVNAANRTPLEVVRTPIIPYGGEGLWSSPTQKHERISSVARLTPEGEKNSQNHSLEPTLSPRRDRRSMNIRDQD